MKCDKLLRRLEAWRRQNSFCTNKRETASSCSWIETVKKCLTNFEIKKWFLVIFWEYPEKWARVFDNYSNPEEIEIMPWCALWEFRNQFLTLRLEMVWIRLDGRQATMSKKQSDNYERSTVECHFNTPRFKAQIFDWKVKNIRRFAHFNCYSRITNHFFDSRTPPEALFRAIRSIIWKVSAWRAFFDLD